MQRLRIALQKSGRLSQASQSLFDSCGIRRSSDGALKSDAINFPLEFLYLRDDDIPQYVSDGVVDCGIVGRDVLCESVKSVTTAAELDFGKCRLALAVRREESYTGLSWFEGRKIATSYPNILREFLSEQGVNAEIEEISGSVEIAPGIGLADGICDIVSSGSTLLTNGLCEVETVCYSQAVLINAPQLSAAKRTVLDMLILRINAVAQARRNKYIRLNAPDSALAQICDMLPGIYSPTIVALARSGWSSLHSVVPEDDFWTLIEGLKQAGAQGILVSPIEKMVV